MIRDQYDDDDIDEDDILHDGERIRVPIKFMDSTAAKCSGRSTEAIGPVSVMPTLMMTMHRTARDEYIRFLQDAHRQPV